MNAQRRIKEFQEYFSKALLLNGDCDFGQDEATLARVRGVHETLGIESANSDLLCAALSGGNSRVERLSGEGAKPQPEAQHENEPASEPEPEPENEQLWL